MANLTYTPAEAAKEIGVSPNTMRELAHTKGFPMFTNGRKILIPKKAFEEWVESQQYGKEYKNDTKND